MIIRLAFTLVAAYASTAVCPGALSAQEANAWVRLDSTFHRDLRRSGAPGGVLAVIRGDSVVHLTAFGVRSVETMDPVTTMTLFRVASATKMLTGLAAATLSTSGALDLRRPISFYVDLKGRRLGRLTMADLLSHTAGLRDAFASVGTSKATSLQGAASAMSDAMVFAPPGEIYSYSNAGFTLAGAVVERAARTPFVDVVASRILRPLGMVHSTFSPLLAMTYPLAVGHAPAAAPADRPTVLRPFVDDGALLPRGALLSTAEDMSRFLIAIMNGGRLEGREVLNPAAVRLMSSIHANVPDDSGNHYGYGLRIVSNHGRREIGHFGGGLGYGAVVRGLPQQHVGVVILANQNNTLLNETADSVLAFLAPMAVATTNASAPPPRLAPPTVTSAEARRLAGTYRNGGGDQVFRLTAPRDTLVLNDDDSELRVVRTGKNSIAAVGPDGAIAIQWTVVPETGAVKYLFAFGRAFRRE